MALLDRILPRTPVVQRALDEAHAATQHVELLEDALSDAMLRADNAGWDRLGGDDGATIDRATVVDAARLCRPAAILNPLIKRGLSARQAFVWGQGVSIIARAGEEDAQDVQAVLTGHMDDPGNQSALYGDQAQEELERALGTDGNVFLACFTSPLSGRVQVRSVPLGEVTDIVTNPEDRDDPWLYLRQWTTTDVVQGPTGAVRQTVQRKAFHPSLRYRPRQRPRTIDGIDVLWDAPIRHVAVNRLDGWQWGLPDAYAAVAWAKAYKVFLEDWAALVKSLSRFAWRATAKNKSRADTMRTQIAGAAQGTGQTAITSPDQGLEAIPKTGATIDSGSGQPLAMMVGAALDLPVTILTGDPGSTGARAVAETLDQPMQLAMVQRQSLWASAHHDVLDHVIDQAVIAPRGPLRGTQARDTETGSLRVQLAGDVDRGVDITFPDLSKASMKDAIDAIVAADGTGRVHPLVTARLLLEALGVDDVDERLNDLTDDDGQFVDPGASAGQAAVDAFRRGEDPAEALR